MSFLAEDTTMKKITLLTVLALACSGAGCTTKKHAPAAGVVDADAASPVAGRVTIPPDSPKLQQIHVAAIAEQDVPIDEVIAPGKIDVNPNQVSRVMLPVTGKIVSTLVRIGDNVKQGQPVLQLESSEADLAISAALQSDAALTQSRVSLIKAQSDYDREKELFAGLAVAKKDVLAAEAGLSQAKAALEQAEAAKNQAYSRLDILGLKGLAFRQKIDVRAPISGKVIDMTVVPGEYRNDTSNAVMTISDLSSLWVVSEVPETSIRKIERGERLEVELTAWPGETFPARVTRIADAVDPTTRTVKVYAEVANAQGRLRPEMYGRIRHIEASRRMPVIPSAAVVQEEKQTLVYREASPGVFDPVAVTLSSPSKGSLGVLTGLHPGDRIVVDGAMLLKSF
ncbi:MAG: efflux transporter, family, subunit [Bryobacterales bacterium]|nr:efflux transporter, family, subunit [Bryobacterales bacterium]